jgi:hypothetical protein
VAQKVHVELVDDLDESPADETLAFALDGESYEIDLNDKHASAIRKALAPYVEAGRKVGGSRGKKKTSRPAGGPLPKDVREWAIESGMDVPARGRIPNEVMDAYAAAH